MKYLLAVAVLLAIGAAPAAVRKTVARPVAAPLAPADGDWSRFVALGSNGAYVMGNPKAKVRLVEYISYTCSHCAHFMGEAAAPLKRDYVAKGLVSLEFRNAVRDQFDMTAALSARCGGAARFFGNSELLLATQNEWMGKAQAFIAAQGKALQKMTPVAGMQAIAQGVGINAILAKRGLTAPQINACIAGQPGQKAISALTNRAWNIDKIGGTPTFIVNGTQLTDAGSWAIVEGSLKAALEVN